MLIVLFSQRVGLVPSQYVCRTRAEPKHVLNYLTYKLFKIPRELDIIDV